jgi:hypothetical protein
VSIRYAVRAGGSHLLVTLALVVGIVGMGLTFTAATQGPTSLMLVGLPLLIVGLYWSGRAYGQSIQLAQARRRHASDRADARTVADTADT